MPEHTEDHGNTLSLRAKWAFAVFAIIGGYFLFAAVESSTAVELALPGDAQGHEVDATPHQLAQFWHCGTAVRHDSAGNPGGDLLREWPTYTGIL